MSRTLIRYVVPLQQKDEGHRMGVNSIVIDPNNDGTLYSAGRDGVICAWDLGGHQHRLKRVIQVSTNWVNQIALSHDRQSVYSCSNDTLVKVWRPNAWQNEQAEQIGMHRDYVKCVQAPEYTDEWIATAGLDKDVVLWDTTGKGERLRINDSSVTGGMKQSVYSLATAPNLIVSGGIEKVVRVWDIRSGQRVTKFIGHTDNVRAILGSQDGKTFVTASSDSTIKIWDLATGRCAHTLTMHTDPVWCLASEHPRLAVFHSGDRSGIVVKADLRSGHNDGEYVAVCRDRAGVNSIALHDGKLFTTTSASDISRWQDQKFTEDDPFADDHGEVDLPSRLITRPIAPSDRRVSAYSTTSIASVEDDAQTDASADSLKPLCTEPEAVIRGLAGLTAHVMLPDRSQVLTSDTHGHVKLWDIIRCISTRDFGKADLDDTSAVLQTALAIGGWCSVNTRVGALTVELDPRNVLDGETYFDQVMANQGLDVDTANQRFNIGKWILYGLFKRLVNHERELDMVALQKRKDRRPGKLDLSQVGHNNAPDALQTPRAGVSAFASKNPYSTPGAAIGLATPMPTYNPKTPTSATRLSGGPDYFSGQHTPGSSDTAAAEANSAPAVTPGGSAGFMKNMKWLRGGTKKGEAKPNKGGAPSSAASDTAPVASQSNITTSAGSFTNGLAGSPTVKTWAELVQRRRKDWLENDDEGKSGSWIAPQDLMPSLDLPASIMISLADFHPGQGEAQDIYRGAIGNLVTDYDAVTQKLPAWLAQILLLNEPPPQMLNTEQNKHYFSFAPHADTSLPDPFNGSAGIMRLGAARSLRIRKALSYISQRLDDDLVQRERAGQDALDETWLEIICGGRPVDPDWTLLMTRRHLWKQGGDMRLEYRLKREAR
ncbi:hypothetical protein PYCC9005_003766 [Savitreella phatthalungensis]